MLKAYLHSKLMFSKPYILKADLYSKMEFSKPYIWFTEYMVYRTLLYSVFKKMEYSEMGLFGAFKSLLCLTILNGLTLWVARACLGTTGNIFLSLQCIFGLECSKTFVPFVWLVRAVGCTAGTHKCFL